jgi:glucosamine-6-phosphate deaminase
MKSSKVESEYLSRSGYTAQTGRIPYIVVDNFPELGLLTAKRFLEWVGENPNGVISLPTGKTPEHFINWTKKLLQEKGAPSLRGLTFVQMDDFYPINPNQHNSFCHYVKEYYIKGLGLDPAKALLINSDEIPLTPPNPPLINGGARGAGTPSIANRVTGAGTPSFLRRGQGEVHYSQIFPDLTIDLTLRHREPVSHLEEMQQKAIFMIDSWCMDREQQIRDLGGIGFFLGGIGPDGHIAFNIKGSDHHSTTRLSPTNYATQAAAAGDLGGIEVSGKRHVITIGLGTITMNPDAVAIIFAAGETKAPIVKAAIELEPSVQYPGSVLQKLPNARFYLTAGAASQLKDVQERYFSTGEWTIEKSIRSVLEYCEVNNIYAHKIQSGTLPPAPESTLPNPERTLPNPSLSKGGARGSEGNSELTPPLPKGGRGGVPDVIEEARLRLDRGLERDENKVILHTGPHHDDIMLGLMPLVNRQLRSAGNSVHFAVATSGFTALSNRYLIDRLTFTTKLIEQGEIQMLSYPDFFTTGYLFKWDKDVSHYLNKVAARDEMGKYRGLSHRIVRCMVKIWQIADINQLKKTIAVVIRLIHDSYDGEKNPPEIQQLKGMIREFEEELVWAHSGIQVKDVHHLRLGFYKGDIFTEQPEEERDVKPILDLLKKIKPDIISVTMDPEGSGPDTHYKVLQATAAALRRLRDEERQETEDGRLETEDRRQKTRETEDGRLETEDRRQKTRETEDIRIIGYRNVWYRYHPAEANVYLPVSLNSLAVLKNSFRQCYLSQVDASFPSPELDAPFCDLAQKVWVDQLKEIQLLLGKDYFYENERPLLRATHGLIFYKELTVDEFLSEASELARRTE